MAGLLVGQAFGVLLLPRFGVSSSSPQVPGHPTSTCDAGVNNNNNKRKRSVGENTTKSDQDAPATKHSKTLSTCNDTRINYNNNR